MNPFERGQEINARAARGMGASRAYRPSLSGMHQRTPLSAWQLLRSVLPGPVYSKSDYTPGADLVLTDSNPNFAEYYLISHFESPVNMQSVSGRTFIGECAMGKLSINISSTGLSRNTGQFRFRLMPIATDYDPATVIFPDIAATVVAGGSINVTTFNSIEESYTHFDLAGNALAVSSARQVIGVAGYTGTIYGLAIYIQNECDANCSVVTTITGGFSGARILGHSS